MRGKEVVLRNSPQSKHTLKKAERRHGKRVSGGSGKVQRAGKLMLNNPFIPPDLDEDIDDDLAFDSEDERLYGHFFEGHEGERRKSSRGKNAVLDAEKGEKDDLLGKQFAALGTAESPQRERQKGRHDADEDIHDDYHEDGQSSDGSDYINLSDMFDMNMKEAGLGEKSSKKKKKKAVVPAEDGEWRIAKKRRAAKSMGMDEEFYGAAVADDDGGATSFSSAIRQIVQKGGGVGSESKDEQAVRNRLRGALMNKHNLLAMDLDDPAKEKFTREEVRVIVEESMSKYKPLLRELDSSKHIQLPLRAPDSVPTPSSIGDIVAASEALVNSNTTPGSARGNAAQKLAGRIGALLSEAGVSRRQLAEEPLHPSSGNSMGSYLQLGNKDGDDNVGGGRNRSAGATADGTGPPNIRYMAKLKAMLTYENNRRRRFNQIKSKAYRRILRKEKDREKERRQKAFELLHPELARNRLAEQLARSRAEERVTQKHKNTSAWVRHAKRFAHLDSNVKDALCEQHALRQKLMQKMDQEAGEDNYERYITTENGDDGEAHMEEERVVDELLSEMVKTQTTTDTPSKPLTSILWKSVKDDNEVAASPIEKARTELHEMKFMKIAREREEREYATQLEALREDVRKYHHGHDNDGDSDKDDTRGEGSDGRDVSKHLSLATTRGAVDQPPAASALRKKFPVTSKMKQGVEVINLRKQPGLRVAPSTSAVPAGDAPDSATAKGTLQDGSVDMQPRDLTDGRRSGVLSTRITIKPEALKRVRTVDCTSTGLESSFFSSGHTASEGMEQTADLPEPNIGAQQEYLISRAFAHDDIDEDFLKEKVAQVEGIMKPEDVNETLPGWGEWGGEDPRLNTRHQEKLAHSAVQKQIEKSFLMKSRADAALDHVIINHDGVELVPDRMTLHMIPRPFSNAQEFARSMRQPLGPEWTSALSFKEGVQPRIEVRQGHSVLPLDLSLRRKPNKTKRRKTEAGMLSNYE